MSDQFLFKVRTSGQVWPADQLVPEPTLPVDEDDYEALGDPRATFSFAITMRVLQILPHERASHDGASGDDDEVSSDASFSSTGLYDWEGMPEPKRLRRCVDPNDFVNIITLRIGMRQNTRPGQTRGEPDRYLFQAGTSARAEEWMAHHGMSVARVVMGEFLPGMRERLPREFDPRYVCALEATAKATIADHAAYPYDPLDDTPLRGLSSVLESMMTVPPVMA